MITIGFIGLGVMGEPICRNLVRAGTSRLRAFDVRREPLERLAADGASAASSLADAVTGADVVMLSLPGGPEVEAVCAELLPSMCAGQTLVDMSTSPVELTRAIAGRFSARGVEFADAPVARTRQAAIDGTLSVMVGASPEVYVRLAPLLAPCASEVTHCGGVGAGQVVKLMNNMVLFQTVNALAEALATAERAGVDGATLLETLGKGSADSFALRNHALRALLPRAYPEAAFPVDYAAKDLAYALELADQAGVDASGARNVAARLDTASKRGLGALYFPAIREVFDPRAD